MSEVKFLWTEEAVGKRAGHYPREEGDRTRPYSERYWSEIEILPPERIREIQWQRLENLLKFTYANSPFYKRRWDEAGVRPQDIRHWEDLHKLPIVTKHDFGRDQEEHPPYGTAPTSPPNRQLKYWQTSGSTRKPRLWCETKEDWENGTWLFTRGFYAHGIRPGWRGFISFGYPPFVGFWLAHSACEWMGCQAVPKGPIPTAPWLALMQNLAQDGTDAFTVATPTYHLRMAEVARQAGIDLRSLNIRVMHMGGEPGPSVPATKRFLEEAWGAQAHDQLGSVETSGPILYTCVEQVQRPEISEHISADSLIVELVHPQTLEPVDAEAGEAGVTVVTALTRFGMPAVRYLLGDLMTISYEPCPCGRTLPLARGGVRARGDDMIIVKGVNIYPSLIEDSVRSTPGLALEYRIRLKPGGAVVLVEPEPDVPPSQHPRLIRALQDDIQGKTLVRLEVELQPPGTLPRDEAKSKRILKE